MISTSTLYNDLLTSSEKGEKQLAVLIDPDKFNKREAEGYLLDLPAEISFILVGGSTVAPEKTNLTVQAIKNFTNLPIILFPGDHSQITPAADAILFLSLISGRNPEYLIEQHVHSAAKLRATSLEIIPTGYILIEGGRECAVERVSKTTPIPQSNISLIVNTALAGQFSGKKVIYLEAGSGATHPVSANIISAVKEAINIPLIVGGGIRTAVDLAKAHLAGADLVVIGTAFENNTFEP
ncbi:geranylgeranylglyceryl/heptaprenylglyceryl phosphate synthase [soil metagenome]